MMTPEFARLIGAKVEGDADRPQPETVLDKALQWQERGLLLFPAQCHLGTPLIKNWNTVYSAASKDRSQIIAWWSEWPDADIGAVPDRSGHFVISACKSEDGLSSLDDLEDEYGDLPAEFSYENRWGDRFFWLQGQAFTSHHKIGRGLHVLGAGMLVYLPPSWTPHLRYTTGE